MTGVCEKCGGTGKIRYRTLGDAAPVPIGNGLTVQDMGGSSTRACSCVRDLPEIAGQATWWDSETIYRAVVDIPIGCEAVEVTADCEVPRRADGRRVHRAGENVYYPPLIDVMVGSPHLILHSDTARELAATLIAAADACDERDRNAGADAA